MTWSRALLQHLGCASSWLKAAVFNESMAVYANGSKGKEVKPLRSVKGYAEESHSIIKSSAEIEQFLDALAPLSSFDREWKSSICYPSPYIAALRNITVLPKTRILLNNEGDALSDEIEFGFRCFGFRPKRSKIDIGNGPTLSFRLPPLSSERLACGIHLTGEYENNYFHWIVEVLPRLFLYEQLAAEKSIPILVSDGLHNNLYELLHIIRAPERPVKRLNKRKRYMIHDLVYPSDLSCILDVLDRAPDTDTVYLPVGLLKELSFTVVSRIQRTLSAGHKRLFIKRSSDHRRLLNEQEIEDILLRSGFFMVDPGCLSIQEQVGLFSQADLIVGPSGAAMVNMLWCQAGTVVIILHADHPFKKYPYWDALARSSGVVVSYLSGPSANNATGSLFQVHDDYRIDPHQLSRLINELTE